MIRQFIMIALIMFAAGTSIFGQQNMDLTVTRIIDASADEVWEVLRELDNIDELSSLVAKVDWTGAKGVGGQRVCTAADGQGYFKESIVAFDDAGRSYSYAVLEGVPAKGMVNSFKVVDLGYHKSMIIWTSGYEAFIDNPQMTKEQFSGFLNQAINGMIDNVAKQAS